MANRAAVSLLVVLVVAKETREDAVVLAGFLGVVEVHLLGAPFKNEGDEKAYGNAADEDGRHACARVKKPVHEVHGEPFQQKGGCGPAG